MGYSHPQPLVYISPASVLLGTQAATKICPLPLRSAIVKLSIPIPTRIAKVFLWNGDICHLVRW